MMMNALQRLIASAFEKEYNFRVTSVTPTETDIGYFRIEFEYINGDTNKLETEVVGQSAKQTAEQIRKFYNEVSA